MWMFPIYGCGCLLAPFFRLLRALPPLARGSVYAGLILGGEYLSGSLLKRKGMCPWDYGKSRWNVGRIIRLDYFPCWIVTGLLMEAALDQKKEKRQSR